MNERDEKFFAPNQFKILGKKKQKSKSTEENTEREPTEKILRKMQKPIWFEIIKKEIEEIRNNKRHLQ